MFSNLVIMWISNLAIFLLLDEKLRAVDKGRPQSGGGLVQCRHCSDKERILKMRAIEISGEIHNHTKSVQLR